MLLVKESIYMFRIFLFKGDATFRRHLNAQTSKIENVNNTFLSPLAHALWKLRVKPHHFPHHIPPSPR